MAEDIKNEQEIVSEAPKGADAPKAGAVKSEPMQKAGDYEDLGPALVKPDQKPGQDKADDKVKKDSSAPTKGATPAEPMQKVKEDADEDEKDKENDKEEDEIMEMPKTKSGMIQAMYDNMNKMKKADIQAAYGKMMAAMNGDDKEKEKFKTVMKCQKIPLKNIECSVLENENASNLLGLNALLAFNKKFSVNIESSELNFN